MMRLEAPGSGSIERRLAGANAFEVGQRAAARRQLGLFDQHVGDVVLDREPRAAARADERITLPRRGAFPRGHTKRDSNASFTMGRFLRRLVFESRSYDRILCGPRSIGCSPLRRAGGRRAWSRFEHHPSALPPIVKAEDNLG